MSGDIEIILASRSPRRKELLAAAGVPFLAYHVSAEEVEYPGQPARTAAANSEMKAAAAGRIYPERVILAADTVVFLDVLLGKPAGLPEARRMLSLLSGRAHTVHTAVTVAIPSRDLNETRVAVSRVEMKKFGPETIEEYLRLANPMDKAGAYGIQEHGELLIRGIRGSLTNIIGLPLEVAAELFRLFRETGDLPARLKTAAENCRLDWLAPPRG
ncbi:MAG: Maf family protein [Candidatus Erginobacter occultus]|nr:Maf family protein [Candidatus Erginobacter occultus]